MNANNPTPRRDISVISPGKGISAVSRKGRMRNMWWRGRKSTPKQDGRVSRRNPLWQQLAFGITALKVLHAWETPPICSNQTKAGNTKKMSRLTRLACGNISGEKNSFISNGMNNSVSSASACVCRYVRAHSVMECKKYYIHKFHFCSA